MSRIRKKRHGRLIAVLISLLTVAVLLSPILAVLGISLVAPAVYEDTFVGELGEKYERLHSIEEEKIVVIGGSSVAFGLDSALMEEHLGKRVVNFGLYADLGTKLMLDLSRSGIKEGDTVVIAPEINDQTLSLFFNAATTLQALDGNLGMLRDIDSDNVSSLVGRLWSFSADKLSYLISGERPENSGAYRKENFNEYGDNDFDRPYNVMLSVDRTIGFDYTYDKTDGTDTEYEQFIDYLNEYIDYCTERGAAVYFSFPPMNEAALKEEGTEARVRFYEDLTRALHCRIISDINDYVLDEGYFFDSEFHLNDSGVPVRTSALIDDLKRELGITSPTLSADELPAPSGYAPLEFGGENGDGSHFLLRQISVGGRDAYEIVGLTEEGMKQTRLAIPAMVDGVPVARIGAEAFAGSSVRSLGVGTNIMDIASHAFAGADMLTSVYLPVGKLPGDIQIPNNDEEHMLATDGAPDGLVIYVDEAALSDFKTNYFWGVYSARLRARS